VRLVLSLYSVWKQAVNWYDLSDGLSQKSLDPDERVRVAVCKVYGSLDYETALHYVSETMLRAIASRFADKKPAVRAQALSCLGKLYELAYPEMYVFFPFLK
jgi:sister chromatid cohesion protein PDS5